MDKIMGLDYSLTSFLNQIFPHSRLFDYFFSFFSLKGSSIFVWLLLILIIVLIEERLHPGISKKDKKFITIFSLTFLITLFISDILLKYIFQRPRPFFLHTVKHYLFLISSSCPKDFSFPSAHAATAFASAAVLTFFDKKRKWVYYTVALLISFSRIYLGCHYLSDVTAGALIGYSLAKVILKVKLKI